MSSPVYTPPVPKRALNYTASILVGAVVPSAVHAGQVLTRKVPEDILRAASLSALAGSYLQRAVLVIAGNESGRHPADYFAYAQSGKKPDPGRLHWTAKNQTYSEKKASNKMKYPWLAVIAAVAAGSVIGLVSGKRRQI